MFTLMQSFLHLDVSNWESFSFYLKSRNQSQIEAIGWFLMQPNIISIKLLVDKLSLMLNISIYCLYWLPWWLSWYRIHLQCGRPGFDPWVGKILWRRERLPTPAFWPGEFHGLYSPCGHKESDMTEWLSVSQWYHFKKNNTSWQL